MDRLGTRHLGSPAEYSAADVLRSTAALFQDWRGKPARKLITEISRRYSGQVTEWGYWWLIVDGVLTFKDPYDWWDEEPEWKQSVDYSEITPTGVLLLNLISAGYFGKAEQPLTLREAPAREGPKIKRRKRRRS